LINSCDDSSLLDAEQFNPNITWAFILLLTFMGKYEALALTTQKTHENWKKICKFVREQLTLERPLSILSNFYHV